MIRRKFMQMLTVAGAGGLSTLTALSDGPSNTATFFVKGFTCVTCATGLDTLLGRQTGVIASTSTYPESKVTVRFHPHQITEPQIVAFIAELGFTVNHASGTRK